MPRIVALDIGTYAVKATIWKSAGRNFVFQDRLNQVVPQDGEGAPTTDIQLATLDAMIEDYPELAQGGNVIAAAWGGEMASLHRISLPFTDLAQVRKTLSFAVEDEVPFDLSQMVMGWRVLSQDVQTEVLVGLARNEEIAGYIEELAARKMEPKDVLIDTEVISCWSGDDTTAILDVGHRRTLVVVAANEQMISTRVVDVGGWHITKAIQKSLECSWEDAQSVKHGDLFVDQAEAETTDPGSGSGVYHRLPAKAREAVDGVLAHLMSEIRSTLIGVEDELGVEVSQVRVGGGGSQFSPISQLLGRHLGVSVYCVVNEAQEEVEPAFLVADGIAEQLTGRVSTSLIDLRQGNLAYRSGMNHLQAIVTYGSLALAVFTLVAGGWYVWQRGVLTGQISEIRDAQTVIYETTLPGQKIRGQTKAMNLMNTRIQEAETRLAALGGDGEPRTVALIHDLTKAFPKPEDVTVDILHLNITPNTIKIDAETTGFAEVAQVEESLKAQKSFENAAKSNEQKKRGKIEFSVQIPLNGSEEEG